MSARQPVSLLNLSLNTVVYQLTCSRGLDPLTATEKGTLPSTVHVKIDLKLQALRSVFGSLHPRALSNVQKFDLACCCGLIGQAKQLRRYQESFERPFKLACQFGQLRTAQWLWSVRAPHEQQAMLRAADFHAFCFACGQGKLETAKWLWSLATTAQQQAMLSTRNYAAFRFACILGQLETVPWLWSLATTAQQQAMLSAKNFYAFKSACQFGQLRTAQWLWSICDPHEQQVLLSADNYAAFRFACEQGQLETVTWLWSLATTAQQQAMLSAENFDAFKSACGQGKLETAKWLWSLATTAQQQAMLSADNFEPFRWACAYEQLETAVWLSLVCAREREALDQFPNAMQNFIRMLRKKTAGKSVFSRLMCSDIIDGPGAIVALLFAYPAVKAAITAIDFSAIPLAEILQFWQRVLMQHQTYTQQNIDPLIRHLIRTLHTKCEDLTLVKDWVRAEDFPVQVGRLLFIMTNLSVHHPQLANTFYKIFEILMHTLIEENVAAAVRENLTQMDRTTLAIKACQNLIFALFPSDARYEKLAHSLRCRILAHPELLQGMMTAFLDTPEQRAMLMQHLKKNPRLMAHLSEEALRVLSQHAQSEHYQSNLQKLLRGIMRPSPTPHVAQTVSLLFKFFGAGVHGLTAKATPETSASAAP